MRRATLATTVFLVSTAAWRAGAEDAPYAEYRALPQLGQIQIVTGFMDRTPDLASRLQPLERQGIVVLEADKARSVVRMDQMGAHRVETTLTIEPPVGHGEGGASSSVGIRIVVDGTVRVDCPLWRGSSGIDRLVFEPERGYITLTAHEGILRFDGFEPRGLVDAGWLEQRAEFLRGLVAGKK